MYKDERGYIKKWVGGKDVERMVHRTIAEKVLGRRLKRDEVVHHIDYDKSNNKKDNLIICSRAFHMILHARTDCIKAGYSPNTHSRCSYHKQYEPIENFTKDKHQWNGLCAICKEAKKETSKPSVWGWKRRLSQQYRRVERESICFTKEGI